MLTETFLSKMEFSDSLKDGTFSIIREPIQDFYVGFPFNFRESTVSDLIKHFKTLGYTLSSSSCKVLDSMQSYEINVFKAQGRDVVPCTVDYLYSVPSWG